MLSRSGKLVWSDDVDGASIPDYPGTNAMDRLLVDWLPLEAGKPQKVLEVGCWSGRLAAVLGGQHPEWNYYGNDIVLEPIAASRRAGKTASLSIADVCKGLPWASGQFDGAYLIQTIEHLPAGQEVTALKEIARCLKPGGSLLLSTVALNLSAPLDPAWLPMGHRHYSRAKLRDHARDAGLEVGWIRPVFGMAHVVATLLFYFYKHVLGKPRPIMPWLDGRVARSAKTGSRWTSPEVVMLCRKPQSESPSVTG